MSQRPNEPMNYFELSSPVLLGPDISCNGQNTSNPQPAGFKDEQQRRSTSLERTLPQYSHVHPQPQSRSPRPLASSDFGNTDEDDGEEEGDETDDPDMISPFQSRGKTLSPKKSPGLAGLGEVGAGQGGTSPSKRLYDQMKGSAVYKRFGEDLPLPLTTPDNEWPSVLIGPSDDPTTTQGSGSSIPYSLTSSSTSNSGMTSGTGTGLGWVTGSSTLDGSVSPLGGSGEQGVRGLDGRRKGTEGDIAPWLMDDTGFFGSGSGSGAGAGSGSGLPLRAPGLGEMMRNSSFPSPGSITTTTTTTTTNPSSTRLNLRQKSLNIPSSASSSSSSAAIAAATASAYNPSSRACVPLTTIAASPPNSNDWLGSFEGGSGGGGLTRPGGEMRREGSYSSQISATGQGPSATSNMAPSHHHKLYRPASLRNRGRSSSRTRQGSGDSTRTTIDDRSAAYDHQHQQVAMDSVGGILEVPPTGYGGRGGGVPVSPSGGGAGVSGSVYGRDVRVGSQASLGSTLTLSGGQRGESRSSTGGYEHGAALTATTSTSTTTQGHDKKKGLSALTGLLKRKGNAGQRPSTGGSDRSDPGSNWSAATIPATAPPMASPPRSARQGSAYDPAVAPFASSSMEPMSARSAMHNPSVTSLSTMNEADGYYPQSGQQQQPSQPPPTLTREPEKGRHSLGRNFLSKARKPSKKPTSAQVPLEVTVDEHPEGKGTMFVLDTDLDDMSGIVRASSTPSGSDTQSIGASSNQAAIDQRRDTMASTASSNSSPIHPFEGKVVAGALGGDKSFNFRRDNPFSGSGDSTSSSQFIVISTPTSPYTGAAKQSLPTSGKINTRRPSQLRNVGIGPNDTVTGEQAQLQPLDVSGPREGAPTVFNEDPFGAFTPRPSLAERKGFGMRMDFDEIPKNNFLRVDPRDDGMLSPGTGAREFDLTPSVEHQQMLQAAWTAPESWGVEGDQIPPPEDDPSSDEVEMDNSPNSPDPKPPAAIARTSGAPPAFGSKPAERRPKARPGSSAKRPTTGAGKSTARPGTSGSANAATNHFIRIYNIDTTFTTLTFPLTATVQDILAALEKRVKEGKLLSQAAPGNMKLYIRERGQDRLLMAHEKPLAIQLRRLLQAGYNDADRVDEMGRENLAMLCRFIYQPPILPIIDPEDEGSYESFELVDLGGRDLQAVPIFLYRHAHSIISLNLSRNPMTDLPLDFIQACSTLRELRMTHMALKRVPPSIRQSCAITRLDLSCNRLIDLEHAGLHEISTLVSLKVQNNRLTTLPASFSELKALKYLNISNNKFVQLPTVICAIHNLVDLDVSFNEIDALPAELGQLSHLERLVAVGNSLVTFPDTFSSLASLRELDVRRNSLTNLNAVYALPNLAIFQADNNNLVVLDAQLGPKVREFGVPHNSITRFTLAPLSASCSAYSLSVLDLSHAKLSTLAEDALAQLTNLHTLNLSYNKFSRLPETLETLGNLRNFSCTDNVLTALPSGIGRLQNLQVLNVHNNNLKELPSGIWQCKNLRELNVSSNLLESFPETPFSMLDALAMPMDGEPTDGMSSPNHGGEDRLPLSKSLRKLLLCDNQLDEEIFESVSMLEELRVLNLSFNDIYEVPTWTISKNQYLEELYLSGNNLTSLPSEDLERLTSLRIIHVNGNKLQTLPAELGKIRKLVTLDVGSNVLKYNIANWPYDWNWNWNLELRYLNLSGNKRLEIKPSAQHEMAYSGGLRRDLSDFSKLSHLRVLGLMDVTLRIPSLPDENEHRRVRTSFSDMNGMGYGISDTIGQLDELSLLDLVVPDFRSREDESLFGMFGLAVPSVSGGRVPKFVQEWMASNFHAQLDKLKEGDTVEDALRRTFLLLNKNCFDSLVAEETGRKGSRSSNHSQGMPGSTSNTYTPHSHQYRSGAAGAVVYVVGKTLHVANAGGILAVISCKGEAEVLSAQHDPFDKEETQRIRAAEAWVSPRGLVNDEIPMSRGFGFFNAVPAVNSLPQVSRRALTDADEFVILANRALWDCCSYQTAVDIARTVKDDPMMAAQKLRDFAISYGSEGSIMIMVLSVADLFRQRPVRSRAALPDKETIVDGDGYHTVTKRVARRRIEDIGDRTLLRLQQEVEPPIGQIAMVFTDIKNSTSLWETNPGMQTAMRMHNSLLRRQLRIIGGYEVKTEGDAFMVSFPSVTSAILWCFTCQLQLLNEDWPREILESEDGREVWDSHGELIARGLSVRMGIHWGNPVWEKDPITRRMDYFGPMVNKSARVSASADGGQIMVSSDVHKVVQTFKTFLDEEDEEIFAEMQDDARRETSQLKKIGMGILEMGKKKLKGLEVPEKLFLIYPRSLAGRLELSAQIRKDVESHAPKVYGGEERVIDLDELRQLAQLCLRLESVAAVAFQQPSLKVPTSPRSVEASPNSKGLVRTSSLKRQHPVPVPMLGITAFLGPRISEEMSDEELVATLMSITGRIENSISTLILLRMTALVPELASLRLGLNLWSNPTSPRL